jgi:nitrite reductase/ring-hydroxylating ferredoxin subunit
MTTTNDTTETDHRVADADDLAVGDHLLVEINGIEIAIYCTGDGYFALANYCVHQGGPLCEGPVTGSLKPDGDGSLCYDDENQVVRCPWHNWEFDIRTGEHLSRPQYSQPTYEVLERDGDLYVRW